MNFVLVSVPIAFLLVFVPKTAMFGPLKKLGYDNHHPREQQQKLTGWPARARAAHANGFESFPAFAAGAIIASTSGAHPDIAWKLCAAYLVLRSIYIAAYIGDASSLRSSVWTLSMVAIVGLMILPLF